MSKWVRRPEAYVVPFEANRYERATSLPPGVFRGPDGLPYVTTIQGRNVVVSVGEWVIQEPDGIHYYPCSDEIFRQRYQLAEGEFGG